MRYRFRTWLRDRGIPLPKGQDCGRLKHEFEQVDDTLVCRHCKREKHRVYLRPVP